MRPQPHRVVLVSPRFFPVVGGGENQARMVAGMLTRAGHEVIVLASRSHRGPWQETMDGYTVVRVPSFRFRNPRGARALAEQALFLAGAGAVLLARVFRFDILFFFWGIDYFATLAGPMRLLGKRTVIRTASTFSREIGNIRSARGAWVRLRMIRVFDAYLALTSELEDRFIRDGIPPERIVRVRNAVDLERFHPATPDERKLLRRRLGLTTHHRVIVYCGHLNEVKGIDFLLRSLRGLRSPLQRTELIVVGSGKHALDPLDAWVATTAVELGNTISVRVVGQVSDVDAYLRAADLFVLPSRSEGMPNVLLEAMASGVACVASHVGGVMDVVRHGVNGMVVPYGDEAALRKALVVLLNNAALRRRLGKNARAATVAQHDQRVLVRQYEELFDRLLHRE